MNNMVQLLMITIVLLVFSATGMYYWNLAAIAELDRKYSKERMWHAAADQLSKDIELETVRIVWLIENPHLYGSPYYPGIPAECFEVLLETAMETYVDSLIDVDPGYWRERYYSLYPGPYLHFAEAYNAQALQYWLGLGEPCLRAHFKFGAYSPNKGFNRTPVSSAAAKPVRLSGGAG